MTQKRTSDSPNREEQGSTGKLHALKEDVHEKREELHEKKEELEERAHQTVKIGTKSFEKGDIIKFAGLIAFFLVMLFVCVLIFPYIKELFEPGGVERVIDKVRGAGPVGVFILLGLQFLQIVVAFIPGEVTQVAAGMLYGPWFGALIILIGCIISSAFIFALVHKLGAPFVQSMVPTKYLEKFRAFEKTGKLKMIVFILFLIPGLPKDVFTYLVPLTDMRMRDFVVLSNIGRIPGVIVSTYAADGLIDGRIWESVIIFVVAAVIAVIGIVFKDKIMEVVGKASKHKED
ncbi:TVP38/TMEM64 family protein [Raoultibacter phocaeensis]|uniref:TVP38/TMEM64 family protein n=1 Tax=Raoultibacter phocaeensis TaxID=2479841 RepID=UPI001119992F|nr:TVP38/TMEM64 family protein [Raoultibacter phocaeensis]